VGAHFQQVLADHTAGDPMKPNVLWTNLSLQAIADRMAHLGTPIGPDLVAELLDHFKMGRRQALKNVTMGQTPERNAQFETIAFYRNLFLDSPNPILSMDTKKRELLGLFDRPGSCYTQETQRVYDHDFPKFADGVAIPHGLLDLKRLRGYINLGTSYDTSEFACDSLFQWWLAEGQTAYPRATALLLLCDGGGSNSASQHLFKQDLQKLADRMAVEIRVAHYPPYTSKYNPIEHRLFPYLTRACQGVILRSVEQVQYSMAKAATKTGLQVVVNILDKVYAKGRKVAENFKNTMGIIFDNVLPKLNYRAIPAPR
jgi:hypothetical protein